MTLPLEPHSAALGSKQRASIIACLSDKGVILPHVESLACACTVCHVTRVCVCVASVSASRGVRHAAKTRRARWSNSLPQSKDSIEPTAPGHQPRGLSLRSSRLRPLTCPLAAVSYDMTSGKACARVSCSCKALPRQVPRRSKLSCCGMNEPGKGQENLRGRSPVCLYLGVVPLAVI